MRRKKFYTLLFSLIFVPFVGIFCCQIGPTLEERELTTLYGDELTVVYETYLSSVRHAYETNDTSQLQETASGYALEEHMRIAVSDNAMEMAEWWKVKLISLKVKEYSDNSAVIAVNQKYIGNIPESNRGQTQPWIVRLEKSGGKWKVVGTCRTSIHRSGKW